MKVHLGQTARCFCVPDTLPLNTLQAFLLMWESLCLGASLGIGVCLISGWTEKVHWINQPFVEDKRELVLAQPIFWTLWCPEFWCLITFQTCGWDWAHLPTPHFDLKGSLSHPQIN